MACVTGDTLCMFCAGTGIKEMAICPFCKGAKTVDTHLYHYTVTSPTMIHYSSSGYEPPEPYTCWGAYLATNADHAKSQAIKDKVFKPHVDEMRADNSPPFKDLKAQRSICSHDYCWGCGGECETCINDDIAADQIATII